MLLPRKPVDPVTKGVKSTACCPCKTFMRPMARLTKMGRRIGGRSSRGSGLALGFTRLALDHGNA